MSECEQCIIKLNEERKSIKNIKDEFIVYTTVSNLGSRNVIEWLMNHDIDFVQRKVNITPLTKTELLEMLPYTENGLEDLLSSSGRLAKLEDHLLSKAIDVLIKHPRYIKKPILFNHKIVQSGFIEGEVHAFIPRQQRAKYYIGV